MLFLAATLSLLIGVVLGTLGGGGAILMLPMLVYALGLEPRTAIASSLFVVGATSVSGMTIHARAGNVRWKVGATFGVAAMTGAYAGGRLAHLVPSAVLLVGFGVVLIVTAVAMLRKTRAIAAAKERQLGHALALGSAVGSMSGLVGAGGGFLVVPALTLFGGLAMREAIGTSLLVIALQSFAGFAGHVSHVAIAWTLVLVLSATSVAGSLVGAKLGRTVSPDGLRKGFAWLVIGMGLFIFARQLPPVAALIAGAATVVAVALVTRATSPPPVPSAAPSSSPSPSPPPRTRS